MTYFEDEILHELNVGEKYSQKQLAIFVVENDKVKVISKTCSHLVAHSQTTHKVLDII